LDLSHSGQQAWQSSMQYYKNHIVGIETQVDFFVLLPLIFLFILVGLSSS